MSTRIQTSNYTRLTRTYLSEVVTPVLTTLGDTIKPTEQRYTVAGVNMHLKFYTPLLAEHFARAFAHLPIPTDLTDLTVYIWDSVGTKTSITPPWEAPRYFSLETNVRQSSADGFVGVYVHYDDTMTLYDPVHKCAYFWTYDATVLPVWIQAAPLRTLFQWALGERDIHLVHGAVVGTPDKAVLLTAKGGSGKSTTSLACLRLGMHYLADDYVAVSRGTTPYAYSLYNSVKVAPYHGNEFDPAHVSETEGEKSIVFLSSLFPSQIAYSAPLKAVMIPQITHRETTTIVPTSKAQAMLALIPTTLFQLPLAESNKMQLLTSVIASLPCYVVELGKDSMEAAEVIRAYIQENL